MADEFERILDECIDRMSRGQSLQQCLNDYPEHISELEPLLRAMMETKEAYVFTPSVDAKRSARLRFFKELDKKRQPALWNRVMAWQPAWAAVASILMVVILIVVSLQSSLVPIQVPVGEPVPTGIPSIVIPAPTTEGNFVFFVSDEENAIGDFSNLYITIEKVVLLKSGSAEELIEFVPEVKQFDLTLLPGDKTQELWRGNIPEGNYTKIFVYVSEVNGVLKTGTEINVKLPSGKLQLDNSFQVTQEHITNFTFDITVVKTGQAERGKYLLKPQASESGVEQIPQPVKDKSKGKP